MHQLLLRRDQSTPDAEGDAFVNGSLSGQLTIGTANNVIIDGNITYADCSSNWTTGQSGRAANSFCPYSVGGTNDSLGLIANNYVEVNHPVTIAGQRSVLPSCGATLRRTVRPVQLGTGGLTIDAAVLALTQSFVVNNYGQRQQRGPADLYGSIQQFARGPVGTFNGSSTGQRVREALHLGPAAQLRVAAQLPGPVHPVLGPGLGHHQRRRAPTTSARRCSASTTGTTASLGRTCRHPVLLGLAGRTAQLPGHHRSVAAHQCHGHRPIPTELSR